MQTGVDLGQWETLCCAIFSIIVHEMFMKISRGQEGARLTFCHQRVSFCGLYIWQFWIAFHRFELKGSQSGALPIRSEGNLHNRPLVTQQSCLFRRTQKKIQKYSLLNQGVPRLELLGLMHKSFMMDLDWNAVISITCLKRKGMIW